MAKGMQDVIAGRAADFGGAQKKNGKASFKDIEVNVWLPPEDTVDKNQLREEEKHLQRQAKMYADILKRWSASVVSDKARKDFERKKKDADKRLKEIRSKLR